MRFRPQPSRAGLKLATLIALAMGVPTAAAQAPAPAMPEPVAQNGSAPSPLTAYTAQMLRDWMTDQPGPATPPPDAADSQAARAIDEWRRFMAVMDGERSDQREQDLDALMAGTQSTLLRSRILEAIRRDPAFQSDQAQFIRRYGFYAGGFNRVFYSLGRLVQGNVQAVAQLGIDAVAVLTRPGSADAETRIAYQKMLAAQQQAGSVTSEERAQLADLRAKVDRALADEDLARAEWSLASGLPETAAFYAAQATLERPGWGKAVALQREAEAAVARDRRLDLASRQMGYPDRKPPYQTAPAELLRHVVAGDQTVTRQPTRQEAMMVGVLEHLATAQGNPPVAGRATMLREWPAIAAKHPGAPEAQRRWLAATLASPTANPDERLARALERRRGQVFRFIFLGPESPRQSAYKAATWTNQSIQALQNVGFFYIFEVFARTGQVFWAPPIPDSEYLDAQAAWLREAPSAADPEARRIAARLADYYREHNRYGDARATLRETGQLSASSARSLDRDEARRLVDVAEQTADPADRQALLAEAKRLAPDIAASAETKKPPKPEKRQWHLNWDTLQLWSGEPLPCGLPGLRAWFDGKPANGEVAMEGVTLEETETSGTLRVTYPVIFPAERRVTQAEVAVRALSPKLRGWLRLSDSQDSSAEAAIRQLDRLPIPFALEGDAGASGFDVYPRLKPIQNPDEPLSLYSPPEVR